MLPRIRYAALNPTFLLIASLFVTPVASADKEDHYDRVHLNASATAQVENDTMVAILYSQEEGSRAEELSASVNKNIRWALDILGKHDAIKVQTNAYSTSPIYNNNKIKGWRVRQSIRLETRDMPKMSSVLGELQSRLALQSVSFTVSPESMEEQESILIDEALGAFQKRAMQITKRLERNDYKIVDINVGTSGGRGNRPVYAMRAMAMEADAGPSIAAGEQSVSVTISGSIELQ